MSLFCPVDRDDNHRSATNEPCVPFCRKSPSGRIASGSFACPGCDVPVTLGGPIPLAGRVRCPFCRSIHSVPSFMHVDAFDTRLNTVELRARPSQHPIELSGDERAELERRASTVTLPWRTVQRARILVFRRCPAQ